MSFSLALSPIFSLPESLKSLFLFLMLCNIHSLVFCLSLLVALYFSHIIKYALVCTCFLEMMVATVMSPQSIFTCWLRWAVCVLASPVCALKSSEGTYLTGFAVPWIKTSHQILPLCEMSSCPWNSQTTFWLFTDRCKIDSGFKVSEKKIALR